MILTARNDDTSAMVIGTLSIPAGSTISLFDDENGLSEDEWDNCEVFCDASNYATINENIGSSDLVIIDGGVDCTASEAFSCLQYMRETADKAAIDEETARVALSRYGIRASGGSIRDMKTATFKDWPTVTVSGSSVDVDFSQYQKATLDLNDQASVTVTLKIPDGKGSFILEVVQGSSSASTITWATEGTHAIKAPDGALTIQSDTDAITLVSFSYNGTCWHAVASGPMQNVIAN